MMDKAKAYDKALERAKGLLDSPRTCFDINQLKDIFPQLKESDDERIRKDIIDHFESIKSQALYDNQEESDNIISSCNEKIAYLEKQKEPHYSPLCNTIKDKIREYIANHFIADTVVKTDMKSIVKAMEEGVRLGKEEQKPAEYIPDSVKFSEGYKTGREVGFREGVESVKPAEWSEEDKRMFSRCIKSIECSKKFADSETYKATKDIEINWLKDIYLNHKKFTEAVNKLWSNEWSEEDEKTINDACCYLGEYAGYIGSKNWGKSSTLFSIVDKLKSLCPSWKPSDEQMEALKNSAYGTYQNGDGPALRELYEQLLKLGVKEEPEYYQHFDPDC